jgi:hypothetical protein
MTFDKPFWSFLRALRADWFAAMSGGFSVPFTAVAVFADNKYAQAIFACMGFGSIIFASYRIWKSEHDKVLTLGLELSPIKIREIEAQEAHTRELQETRRANDPLSRTIKENFASQMFGTGQPKLALSVGTEPPFVATSVRALYSVQRIYKLKVENHHHQKLIARCKISITEISPSTGYTAPWTLQDDISLAAGEHAFIDLVTYGEALDAQKYDCADTMMILPTLGHQPILGIETPYTINIRATGTDAQFCDLRCKVWVENGKLKLEQV